jgi:hypothetical protein
MTEIHRAIIPPPAAWTSGELGGKAPLVREAGPAVVRALDDLAARLRGRALPQVTRADMDHPALNALMDEVRADVMEGRGIGIVRGPEPGRYDPDDYQRLYWGLGTYLGRGVVQSFFGDHVARVERNPDLPWRGTTTDMELRPHTDFHEVMSLAAVSLPVEGGVSGFVSSLAVHNEVLRARPDLLPVLYEGWYNVSVLKREASPRKTPIFSCTGGQVSCFYNRVFFQKPDDSPEPFPEALTEAMRLMDQIAGRPDIRADFTLEPGEIAFWHNFTVMHSRTAFQDSEERRRLLLRLWLNVDEGGRPMSEEIRARARVIDRDHLEGQRPAPVPA